MALSKYVVKRILEGIPVFVFVTIIIFILPRLAGVDPAQIMLGPLGTEEAAEALRQRWARDESLYVQYL
jgi:peptide/nickel transport system permease protein